MKLEMKFSISHTEHSVESLTNRTDPLEDKTIWLAYKMEELDYSLK